MRRLPLLASPTGMPRGCRRRQEEADDAIEATGSWGKLAGEVPGREAVRSAEAEMPGRLGRLPLPFSSTMAPPCPSTSLPALPSTAECSSRLEETFCVGASNFHSGGGPGCVIFFRNLCLAWLHRGQEATGSMDAAVQALCCANCGIVFSKLYHCSN